MANQTSPITAYSGLIRSNVAYRIAERPLAQKFNFDSIPPEPSSYNPLIAVKLPAKEIPNTVKEVGKTNAPIKSIPLLPKDSIFIPTDNQTNKFVINSATEFKPLIRGTIDFENFGIINDNYTANVDNIVKIATKNLQVLKQINPEIAKDKVVTLLTLEINKGGIEYGFHITYKDGQKLKIEQFCNEAICILPGEVDLERLKTRIEQLVR